VLEVSDLERAERFYSDTLELPVVERWPHRNAVWVLAGGTRIGLWEPQVGLEGSRGGAHVHFAIQIDPQSFDERVEAIRRRGHEVPVHHFNPIGAGEPSRSAYVLDPDEHLVEFWTASMSDYLK
jgi:catechol 2,3-dioxygenase-like lactoylglutathione lyase family enzyme